MQAPAIADGVKLLSCRDLRVHFGDRLALSGITIDFRPGEIVSLLGPNGAGKSTLLRVLAGLLGPTHGAVRYGEAPLAQSGGAIIYVPQRTTVDWTFPVSVLDVVLMALARRRSRFAPIPRRDRDAALASLDQVGMGQYANVQIGQLSGGQQQRVFLARALLQAGKVVLLDEPFGGVDVPTQELLRELLASLAAQGNIIVSATHDLAQASNGSHRVVLLDRRIVAEGPPREVMTAANLIATFGGQAIVPPDLHVSAIR